MFITKIINIWISQAVKTAREKGWHETEYTDKHFLALIISEICEAMQADRNYRTVRPEAANKALQAISDDYEFELIFDRNIKDTFEDELADVIIRCCDFLGLKEKQYKPRKHCRPDSGTGKFSEVAYDWIEILTDKTTPETDRVCNIIDYVTDYCEKHRIDIEKFVELKMQFNPTRPYKHGGKKY